jgi:hypothetical protein
MILSDKVAEIIKQLNIHIGIQEVALESALKRINELKAEIYELRKRLEQ